VAAKYKNTRKNMAAVPAIAVDMAARLSLGEGQVKHNTKSQELVHHFLFLITRAPWLLLSIF